MARKNKKLDEKIDTQVLNLQEIKEAASKEKKIKKNKSTPVVLLFLGLFMIVMGILQPIIMETIEGESEEVSDTATEPNSDHSDQASGTDASDSATTKLACTLINSNSGLDATSNITFEFDEVGLNFYHTQSEMTAITDENKESLKTLVTTYQNTFGKVEAEGFKFLLTPAADYSKMTMEQTVDFKTFDVNKYNTEHPENTLSFDYQKGQNIDQIRQMMTGQGATCQ